MNLLALDTSSEACSVALAAGERRIERHAVEPRAHTRLLVPMIREVLADGGLDIPALHAIVLGNGPGSFIGMRIAASVAQGLAHGAALPVVPVSSLACVAAEALESGAAGAVIVAQDARMGELYVAAFRRGDDGLPLALGETRLHPADAPLELPLAPGTPWLAAGEGWQRHPQLSSRVTPAAAGQSEAMLPRAIFLLELGRRAFLAGEALPPASLEPAYVRSRVAREPGGRETGDTRP